MTPPSDPPAIRAALAAAKATGPTLAALSGAARSALLGDLAAALEDPAIRGPILAANHSDLERATQDNLAPAKRARLALAPEKLDGLADGLRQLARAPELLGTPTLRRELDDGLVLERMPCPLGTLGVVFEARPDAVPQIAGLALKSGNALILKGGREALASNRALVAALHRVLLAHGLPPALLTLLGGRDEFAALLEVPDLGSYIDLIVARGSTAFVEEVTAAAPVPVMGHAEGLCHIYLHPPCDPAIAARIVVDAKCSYPAACNAVETLLWHPEAGPAVDACIAALAAQGVALRGCPATLARVAARTEAMMAMMAMMAMVAMITPADPSDWSTEYGAPILAIRQVADLAAATAHIATYGSRHTEAIVTADAAASERFIASVDAAAVFVNASTRFADGYRFGLGAEVGISTGKLHARGPVGVDGLLTYRWILRGHGEVASDYGPGKRAFVHRDLGPGPGPGSADPR